MFVKTATDKTLINSINSNKTVLVKAGATWCPPCKALAPTLEKVAEERTTSLPVYDLDIDDSPSSAQSLKIQGVPTMVLFHNGVEVSRKTGNVAKGALDTWLNSELEKVGGR
jgi:thioredoxin